MRIFIAIRFTRSFKTSIEDAQNALQGYGVSGNYTCPENLHLTLAFIGETERITDINAAVSAIKFEPFEIQTDKLGCFKRQKQYHLARH
nr:RNA 2',3'-cyclic phosphodiesterase [uncultured Prevotella sp.]